jgi:hypothetical protein
MIGCMDDKVFPLPFAWQRIRKQGYALHFRHLAG